MSTAERFRQELDRVAERFAVASASTIPLPTSLCAAEQPPGLIPSDQDLEVKVFGEMSVQTDVQIGHETWIVSIGNQPQQSIAISVDNQEVTKFQPQDDADDEFDDCPAVDCVECDYELVTDSEDFKQPDEYEFSHEKLVEYGYEEDTEVPPMTRDVNFGKKPRRAAKKTRQREARRALLQTPKPIVPLVSADELAPIGTSVVLGRKSDGSKPGKSHTLLSQSNSLSSFAADPLDVQALVFVTIYSIMLAAGALATEVMDVDIAVDLDKEEKSEHPLLVTEKEHGVCKSVGRQLQEKIRSMIRIRKGFTVDSGAADHVMPLGWLAWILVTASLGSIRGVNFISANGAKIPNKGEQKVRFLTPEGTWASWIFQVAGINKPLVSVSKLIADGWRVVFDDERSYLLHKASGHTIDVKLERGIFTIDAFVEPASDATGFTRQA